MNPYRPPEAAAVAALSNKGAFTELASANMDAPAGAEKGGVNHAYHV